MTVHFIGAGPGAPDLITVRGLNLVRSCSVCLYAGSLVPPEILEHAPEDADIVDSAPLNLDEIIDLMRRAHVQGKDIARLHSGDPSLYGAIAEQMRRLKRANIPYDVVPGVPAFSAAAAALKQELTIPEIAQSVILTRTSMKSSAMPEGESLTSLARSQTTLAIHLSIRNLEKIQRDLIPIYGEDCPVVVAYRVSWPDEQFLFGTLSSIREKVRAAKITRTALILVGPALSAQQDFRDSALYDPDHVHILRHTRPDKST